MKSTRILYPILAITLVSGWLALPLARGAIVAGKAPETPAAKDKDKSTAASTNSVKAPLPIPSSVFDVTATPTKDPFFPNSVRQPNPQRGAKVAVGVSASAFLLNCLSGSTNERLAMINHRTLGVGETADIIIAGGKVTFRLLQIKENSVVIRVIAPPQQDLIELSLSGEKDKGVYIGPNDSAHPPQR